MTRKKALIDLRDKVKAGGATEYSIFREARLKSEWQALDGDKRHDAWKSYQGSLDAAKALHEAVLPGWFIRGLVQRGEEIWEVVIWPDFSIVWREDMKAGTSSNPARAWLLSILEALIAQEGD